MLVSSFIGSFGLWVNATFGLWVNATFWFQSLSGSMRTASGFHFFRQNQTSFKYFIDTQSYKTLKYIR